jgi:hypothetical protein
MSLEKRPQGRHIGVAGIEPNLLPAIAGVQKVEIITKQMNHTGSTMARMYNFSQSNESWTGAQIATKSGA